MNHYTACRAEAARCRQKADQEAGRRKYWLAEAENGKCALMRIRMDLATSLEIK
jgi:hypothetical protein